MSKVMLKPYGLNFINNKCDKLSTKLTAIQAKISSVTLPFPTSILDDANANLNNAKNTITEYKSAISNAAQFATNADSEFKSQIDSVDKWDA